MAATALAAVELAIDRLAADETAEGTVALPPHTKAEIRDAWALVPAFCGLIMLGIAFVVLIWWAARIVRRQIHRPMGSSNPHTDAWYSKPLAKRAPPLADDQESTLGS